MTLRFDGKILVGNDDMSGGRPLLLLLSLREAMVPQRKLQPAVRSTQAGLLQCTLQGRGIAA